LTKQAETTLCTTLRDDSLTDQQGCQAVGMVHINRQTCALGCVLSHTKTEREVQSKLYTVNCMEGKGAE